MIIQIPKNILSIYEISMKNYELVILITNNSSVNLHIYMTKRWSMQNAVVCMYVCMYVWIKTAFNWQLNVTEKKHWKKYHYLTKTFDLISWWKN